MAYSHFDDHTLSVQAGSKPRGPIIIGGAPSTGSTLLRVLLGRHPNIAAGDELAVFDKPALLSDAVGYEPELVRGWLEHGYPVDFVGGSRRIFANLEGYPWTRAEIAGLCRSCGSYKELLDTFFERNLEAAGACGWLEKTPSNVYSFRQIAQLYPEARFIHIVRDARDAIASYNQREKSVFKAVSRWYYATLSGIQYRGCPRYYEIKYEDLVQQPAESLALLCGFLGEEFTPTLLGPEGEPASSRSDSSLNPNGEISQQSIGKYRARFSDEHAAVFASTRLSRYGLAALPSQPRSERNTPTPIELQVSLGYSTEGLTGARPLDRSDILRHWHSLIQHRKTMSRLYGRSIQSHTYLRCGLCANR